jgi:hypothetical protein
MTNRDQKVEMNPALATGKAKPRRPYEKPQLTVYGKLAELTAGVNGSIIDPGHSNFMRRG